MKQNWAYIILIIFVFVALLAGILANDKPVICKINDHICMPVIGGCNQMKSGVKADWKSLDYQWVIWSPIAFNHTAISSKSANYKSPGQKDRYGFRHWLGTDLIGRDIASGLVHGARSSLLVGFLTALITLLIGLPMGIAAGYFGDYKIKLNVADFAVGAVCFLTFIYFVIYHAYLSIAFLIIPVLLMSLYLAFRRMLSTARTYFFPLDMFMLRVMEIVTSLPGLLILLVLCAIFEQQGPMTIALILGLLLWTRIAILARNECLRVRDEDYLLSAEALGISEYKIVSQHVLPNIITPIVVALAFIAARAILLEATLSFLGIGIALDEQTWGSILAGARLNFKAWWLAVFPGICIFLTILSLHQLGEHFLSRLNKARNDFSANV